MKTCPYIYSLIIHLGFEDIFRSVRKRLLVFQSPSVAIMSFIFFVEIYSFVFGHINLKQCFGIKTSGMGYTVNE